MIRNKRLNRLRVIKILVLLTAALPAFVISYKKKKTWEESLKANTAAGEQTVDGWYAVGPFYRTPILLNSQFPPEKKFDSGGYVYGGKKLKWKKIRMHEGILRIESRHEYCVYADFT